MRSFIIQAIKLVQDDCKTFLCGVSSYKPLNWFKMTARHFNLKRSHINDDIQKMAKKTKDDLQKFADQCNKSDDGKQEGDTHSECSENTAKIPDWITSSEEIRRSIKGVLVCREPPVNRNHDRVTSNREFLNVDLGDAKHFIISVFKKELKFTLRIFGMNEAEELYPTKKGVCMDVEKWKKIQYLHSESIDTSILELRSGCLVDQKIHLGENVYVSIQKGYNVVDIRRWWFPDGADEVKPTRSGITLTFDQWDELKKTFEYIENVFGRDMDNVEYCENSVSHSNQMGFLECIRCNPNQMHLRLNDLKE